MEALHFMEKGSAFFKAMESVRAAQFKGGEKTQQTGDGAQPVEESWECKEARIHFVRRAGPAASWSYLLEPLPDSFS